MNRADLQRFAEVLAPACRRLRDHLREVSATFDAHLTQAFADWRRVVVPAAADEQFADAYAQMVTFALLLGRIQGAEPLSIAAAEQALAAQQSWLSQALHVLTNSAAQQALRPALDQLEQVIATVAPGSGSPSSTSDVWLYFYEDFLAAYDPVVRQRAGVYYTPIDVVQAQVRLIDDLLRSRLDKPLGFADPAVMTLDPALGSGTYLLGVIEHALHEIQVRYGEAAVPQHATLLAQNLYGFELLVGPYAVSQLRITSALQAYGARGLAAGAQLYVADTLQAPQTLPQQVPARLRGAPAQQEKALQVQQGTALMVCFGNPPYGRHGAATNENWVHSGGWVRWGERRVAETALLEAFLAPAKRAGYGMQLKNVYNLYVYFWRWALWQVFEQAPTLPGIVSFVTPSSYLDGAAFIGMREHLRRLCDTLWIIDLGGEGRGTRREENVFHVQTPLAIAIAFGAGAVNHDQPAQVYFTRITGSRAAKLATLQAITSFATIEWQACPSAWHAPFRPVRTGTYFKWPLLTDLMPWQHSGAQFKRTWPIAPDAQTLERRWQALLQAADRAVALKESRDRTIHSYPVALFKPDQVEQAVATLPATAPMPPILRYGYRSFDRQWALVDTRLGDYLRPALWRTSSAKQIYFSGLFSQPPGTGPVLTVSAYVPDLDAFRGSYGAKAVLPLYRNAEATAANLHPQLLALLSGTYGREVIPEDVAGYVYGVLAQPQFSATFEAELASCEVRVPLTKDPELFKQMRKVGAQLIFLHTYGERFSQQANLTQQVIYGRIPAVQAIPDTAEGYPASFAYDPDSQTLAIGAGSIRPVAPQIYQFEVSGLKVVQSWLKYRMKNGGGKKSSPLDAIRPQHWSAQSTVELVELLLILEQTVRLYPEQAGLLQAIVAGPCFAADELGDIAEELRKPPAAG